MTGHISISGTTPTLRRCIDFIASQGKIRLLWDSDDNVKPRINRIPLFVVDPASKQSCSWLANVLYPGPWTGIYRIICVQHFDR